MVEKEKYLAFQNLSMSGCTVEKGAKTGLTKVGEGGGILTKTKAGEEIILTKTLYCRGGIFHPNQN